MKSTLPGFDIVPAGALMVPVLAQLHGACFDRPWTRAELGRLLALPGMEALIVMRPALSPVPVGFVLCRTAGDEGEILTLCIDSAWRRAGAARALMRGVIDRMSAQGVSRIFLEVADANTPARRLYLGSGFACVGRRAAYYHGTGGAREDALILRLDIVPATPDRYDVNVKDTALSKRET